MFVLCLINLRVGEAKMHTPDGWKEFKGKHFLIYYKQAPLSFVQTIAQAAEEDHEEIARSLGFTRYKEWSWDDRAKIYDKDYVDSGSARWSHGMTSPEDRVIRTFPMDAGFFDSILPHELGHIVFHEFVGFKAQVPLWFEEGIAMYQEKAKRFGANDAVRAALADGTFIPLKELSLIELQGNAKQELVTLFYAESASVVNYMITDQGDYRFVRFCKKLKEGGPFDWALHDIYVRFRSLDDLNRAWIQHLEK